nr:immunoglobulin heavy chain junction region [Mus musculus]
CTRPYGSSFVYW